MPVEEAVIPMQPGANIPGTHAWFAHQATLATGLALGQDWDPLFIEPAAPGDVILDIVGEPLVEKVQETINLAILAGILGLTVVAVIIGGVVVYRLT